MLTNLEKGLRRAALFAGAMVSLFLPHTAQAAEVYQYAVDVTATVQTAPPQIRLNWALDPAATGYMVSRKLPSATSWTTLTSLAGNVNGYTDGNVTLGSAFEYRVVKTLNIGITAYGYILAGVDALITENRGKLILVVDNTYASALASELTRLQQDLTGDGWTVIRKDVSRNATVPSVKNLIKSEYDADKANVKAALLFGHVPVPRSGNINPDGHDNHVGAWAADTYYADMDGTWTDTSVNNTSAERTDNYNVPGDGRFDQGTIPSDLELAVGRVDLSNMTCFSNKTPSRSELDLLRAYLEKDHNFRHGLINVPRRGLIADNFGDIYGEAFGASAWRSFAPMFGQSNLTPVYNGQYFPTLSSQGYLFTYACGGGSYYTCAGVGGSDDFALNNIQAVFTMHFGSYFGDWDNESNFLRASLGSGYALTTSWSGRPHWFYHRMALGEPIGDSARLSMNNSGAYQTVNQGGRGVNNVLLGDPTLRLHPVLPPSNLIATAGSGLTLSWTGSSETAIKGYNVYRAATSAGPFTRVNSSLLGATTFTDTAPIANGVYMVRAVKLESSPSGTYYNPSQGVFYTNGVSNPTPPPVQLTPAAPTTLSGAATYATTIKLSWTDNSTNESGFKIFRSIGSSNPFYQIAVVPANAATFTNTGLNSGSLYSFKVVAYNDAGDSPASNVSTIATPVLPTPPSNLNGAALSSTQIRLSWTDASPNESGFRILRKTGASGSYVTLAIVGANMTAYTNQNLNPGIQYFYKVAAQNEAGVSVTSNEINLTTVTQGSITTTAATFLKTDESTHGDWSGVYGSQGYWIYGDSPSLPSYARVTPTASEWIWAYQVADTRALLFPSSSSRVAACWFSGTSFTIDVNLTDGALHRVALYALDWDRAGRIEKVEVLDAATGATLSSQTASDFPEGIYLVWQVKGNVRFRISSSVVNSVISGLFIDPAS